jgi:tetratricopeptide (TPR) repeat protein
MKTALGLGFVLASACAAPSAQIPEECKLPVHREQVLRDNPSAKAYGETGAWFSKQGNLVCAMAAFEEAVRLEPHSAQAHYDLGAARVRAHQLSTAVVEFRVALQYKPGMTMAHNSLGSVLMDMGKAAEAETEFREALRLDPRLAPALVGLGILCANKGDNEGAVKLFRQAIAGDPNYEQGHLNLGLILAKQQKLTEAEGEVDQAMQLAPEDAAALAAVGRVKARLGKSAEGVALLRKAVTLAPQSSVAHLDLGMVLAESYDLTGALTESSEAVRLAPGSALAHLNRGRVLFDLGRNTEAKPDLELASRLAPEMPEPFYFLAVIDKQAGHYNRAVVLLQTVVKLQPRNATAWNLLGQSLEYGSQTQAAIAAWRHAVAIDPDNSQALWSLARAIKPADPDEAARLMVRYREVQEKRRIADEAGTLGNDALAAGVAHDWPEAIRKFQKAIEVCGDCAIKADLHKKLGLIDCQMGDIESGEKELRLAQALKPADPDIERALERIAVARTKGVTSRSGSERPH